MASACPAIRSRRIAEAHFVAEASNDLDVVMGSIVGGDLLATAVVENLPEGPSLVSCGTAAEQRQHYTHIHSRIRVLDADLFTSIGGGWYGFVHGIVRVELVTTGDVRSTEMLGVMPVSPDEDVILGEIGLSYPSEAKQGDEPGEPALQRVANFRLHEEWIAALRSADVEGLAACYSGDVLAAARQPGDRRLVPLRGRGAVCAHYEELFRGYEVESVDVALRVIDRWYVFTELAWVLRDGHGDRHLYRSANALVIGVDGRILVDLGYGAELERLAA